MEDRASADNGEETAGSAPGRSPTLRFLKKTGIGALGGVVIAAGLVMLVTPGPGVIVTLAGLGILGREFPAAKRQLHRLREAARRKLKR